MMNTVSTWLEINGTGEYTCNGKRIRVNYSDLGSEYWAQYWWEHTNSWHAFTMRDRQSVRFWRTLSGMLRYISNLEFYAHAD